jgi:transcriptional regulator of arginine metabolism
MISIKARQGTILEIAHQSAVRSQEELSSLLKARGIHVTQSTLSRDIRELGLVKVRGRYEAAGSQPAPSDESLRRAFKQFIIRTGVSANIVMIKTSPGNAHSIGAVLDAAQWPEVLGTVAGDDTVFVLLQKASLGKIVLKKIKEFSL